MIPVHHRNGQTLYVFGLGHTGLSAITALRAGGANVLAWDDRDVPRNAARDRGAVLIAPGDVDWNSVSALVLSPGVPLTHPEPHEVAVAAMRAGVAVIGDTELFVREVAVDNADAYLIAVTGTNGKSTTTALIGHLLAEAGEPVEVGGNIGSSAVLELSPALNPIRYVIEFSSYQLDLTPSLKPDVAVFLNLSPDHLERHGDMDGYADAKARIFARQSTGDWLVLGQDDPRTAAMAERAPAGVTVVPISRDSPQDRGIWGEGAGLVDATAEGDPVRFDLDGIMSLRGSHNRQNAAAAVAVARAAGLSTGAIETGLRSFPGLAHRMEVVAHRNGVVFVNDSKATNAEAAEKSLQSYAGIHWIAGGRAKAGGIEALRPCFERVEKAYLIGEAAPDFARTLSEAGVEHEICRTLENAVPLAAAGALESMRSEACVLLAPACASFDQFPSFEVRGDQFRAAVEDFLDRTGPGDGGGS